jgi:hypothetical protein
MCDSDGFLIDDEDMEDDDHLDSEFDDEDDCHDISLIKYKLDTMDRTLNNILLKYDEIVIGIEQRVDHLSQLDEKVTENMKRLNNMLLEFKGLVQIVRGKSS